MVFKFLNNLKKLFLKNVIKKGLICLKMAFKVLMEQNNKQDLNTMIIIKN